MEKLNRKVFYLAGFDPRGVRYYYGLYREQVARYAALSGEDVTVSARRAGPASSAVWTVTNDAAGVETDYEFLRWEDLVAGKWIRSPLLLAWRSVGAFVGNLRFMQLVRMRRLRKGPVITILYPPILGTLIPLVYALVPALLLWIMLPFWAAAAIGVAVSAVTAGRRIRAMMIPWLLRFHAYHHRLAAQGPGPELDERLDLFARRIVETFGEPWDEILIITHSAGTIQAMSLLRRLLDLHGPRLPDNVTLVCMGQVVPVVGLRTDACWYHADLRALADKQFRYVDFSAPPDGAAYYNVNPLLLVADQYVARVDMLSPRFHIFYDPENRRHGYASKYEAHFDYLRVGDRISPVDFVSLTAGPRTIDESIALFRALP
ncbi:MAG: hypothetical protein ABW039_04470 [Sphingobium sp.]